MPLCAFVQYRVLFCPLLFRNQSSILGPLLMLSCIQVTKSILWLISHSFQHTILTLGLICNSSAYSLCQKAAVGYCCDASTFRIEVIFDDSNHNFDIWMMSLYHKHCGKYKIGVWELCLTKPSSTWFHCLSVLYRSSSGCFQTISRTICYEVAFVPTETNGGPSCIPFLQLHYHLPQKRHLAS